MDLRAFLNRKIVWIAVIGLLAALFLWRCSAKGDAAPKYVTDQVARGDIVARVSASGSLSAVVTVEVGSQVSGRIQALYADFNSVVKKGERIAKIDLFGLIAQEIPGEMGSSMVDDLILQIRQAAYDDSVAALLIHIDSPGGEVTASDTLYRELLLTREEKPVIVYMDSVAASGGYYTAVGGSHLVAHELCVTGSIGVILQTLNFEGLSKILGVSSLTFKSGALKDLLNPSRPATEQEKKLVQDMILETFDRFSSIVIQERNFADGKLPGDLSDGAQNMLVGDAFLPQLVSQFLPQAFVPVSVFKRTHRSPKITRKT